jgi:dolichyl-phosphate-mannose-protein mannosyltransferase
VARQGGWMTPTFLGRPMYEKPPLLIWLSALSIKLFGIHRYSARFPALLAGALVCALIYWITRTYRGAWAAATASALALSSSLLVTMSRRNMTDILLTAAVLSTVAIAVSDPAMRRRSTPWALGVSVSAALLAKSLAGALMLGVLFTLQTGIERNRRAPVWRLLQMVLIVSALTGPWFLYSFLTHRGFFLADLRFQLLTAGSGLVQTTSEPQLSFYARRLVLTDPAPLILALTSVAGIASAIRARQPAGLIIAAAILAYTLGLFVFQLRSERYLCPLIAFLILAGCIYSPLLEPRWAPAVFALVGLSFAIKAAFPDQPWGIPLVSESPLAAAPLLSRYCAERRATDLFLLDAGDEFYSALLPLPKVHYGWIDPSGASLTVHPHLRHLGILLDVDEATRVRMLAPNFRDRLREWGATDTAIASGIVAAGPGQFRELIKAHPESDFLVSRRVFLATGLPETHRARYQEADLILLESKLPALVNGARLEPGAWTCWM